MPAGPVVLTDGGSAETSEAPDSIESHGRRGHAESERRRFLVGRR